MTQNENDKTTEETIDDLAPTADPKGGQALHITTAGEPQQILIGLLLPAVQKVRG